jgi:hypothetical protein
MKKIALLLTAIALTCTSANAQSLLKQLGNRAKNAVERNVENKVEKAIKDALDGNKESKKDNMGETSVQETIPQEYELVDPYTVTGRPLHSIPIGLPQNDDAPAPTSLPADCVSYCAYEFDPVAEDLDGSWKKVFYNAGNRRKYVITYNEKGKVSRALTIPDSLAFYKIDPEKKIIQKYSVSNAKELLGGIDDMFDQKSERGVVGSEIEATDGRWCYRRELITTSTDRQGGTREIKTYEYVDLETGILIRKVGGNKNFLRGIRIGLFYPELFELPEGYTMKTIDLTRAMGALRNNNNR